MEPRGEFEAHQRDEEWQRQEDARADGVVPKPPAAPDREAVAEAREYWTQTQDAFQGA